MAERSQQRTGRCLCGGVTYRVDARLQAVLQCHCDNCRRTSGNFVAASRADTDTVHIDSEDTFRWHDLGYARYGFCTTCGSTLFYQAADRGDITSVMVGTLDDASDLEIGGVWFTDDAQPHNTLPAGVPHYGGDAAVTAGESGD